MKYYVGIDLGGTNIVAGVVDEEYNIIAKASTKTNCPRPEKEIRLHLLLTKQQTRPTQVHSMLTLTAKL